MEYLDGAEERAQSGSLELVGLLDWVALSDEDESVALAELAEGCVDGGKKLNLVRGYRLCERKNARVARGSDGIIGELFEAVDQ